MNTKSFLKLGLVAAGVLMLASCAKNTGGANGADGGLLANGLGKLTHFAGQEEGEMYTTQAPHNQIYLFPYDSSTLSTKYMASVNAQADYLRANPGARVLIAGHTDERGSREYNIALGERRANTVAELIKMTGVNSNQVRVVSYGKERPVYLGHDEESHSQNRRDELTYEATK